MTTRSLLRWYKAGSPSENSEGKNHMTIEADQLEQKKAINKIQHPFMICKKNFSEK